MTAQTLPHFDPPPHAAELGRPFWEAVERGELVLPRCSLCKRWQWYPDGAGADCPGGELEWTPVATTGTVYTWTRVHRPFLPRSGDSNPKDDVPYVVGFVDLDGVEGLRLVTNLTDDEATVRIGARVRAVFVPLGSRRHPIFTAW
jgi:uncharacterized OB-fold protein